MPSAQSVYTTRRGEFRDIYRRLCRHEELRARTPVVFCEGDSWFSTPASMNILDHLVFPAPDNEARGVPIFGHGGLFFRAEDSGDLATKMFAPRRLKDIMDWYGSVDFDIALISAGGNDLVSKFLKQAFEGQGEMSVESAFALVEGTGRFDEVHRSYERALTSMIKLRPKTPIVAHSYCYPLRLGVAADLTVANIGLIALLKKNVGPWIGPNVGKALPALADQRRFARMMIDGFVEQVLERLAGDARFSRNFSFIDIRKQAPQVDDWFDEMHPTGSTFKRLSEPFAKRIEGLFVLR